MDEKATGLVLRTRPLTETSLIVHWLTAEHGRLATVAKGAHRPKSPFRGKLDLFFLAELVFVRSRRSELHVLREVTVRDTHASLRTDLASLQRAAYGVQLVELLTESDTPLPGLFQLFREWLGILPRQPESPLPVLALEIKCLADAGLAPDAARGAISAGAREIVRLCGSADWERLASLRASPAQLSELRQFLHGFLQYHLGKVPPARAKAVR